MFCNRKLVLRTFILYVFCAVFLSFPVAGFAVESAEKTTADAEYASIDFNNVDITVFIKFISKLTGKNFIVDSRVKGNVTIISPTKLSVKDAYKVFESVLEINGFSTVESGKIIKIVPMPKASQLDVPFELIQHFSVSIVTLLV